MRLILPLVQMILAVGVTGNFIRSADARLPRIVLYGLNAPATLAYSYFERLAMLLCPSVSMTGPSTGCDPLHFIFETVIYTGLIGLLWLAVSLEATGGGRSVLTARTGARAAADGLAILLGVGVVVFGIGLSLRLGRPWYGCVDFATFLAWGVIIVWFYGRDLLLDRRDRRTGQSESTHTEI
jgi:hypothetical protein